jgi:Ca2+-binding EF-hand superfamily protein
LADYYLNKKLCTSCGPGQYKNPFAHSCSDCAIGKKSSAAVNANCENCGEGQYSFSTKLCKDCGAGKYSRSADGANSECFSCDSGKFSSRTSNSVCTSCSAGQYKNPSAHECIECGNGKISTGSANAGCEGCPKGKEKKPNSHITCEFCSPGQYSIGDANHRCKNCENGRSTSETGKNTRCDVCSAGKGKESHTKCSICRGGQYSSETVYVSSEMVASMYECNKCDAGKFSEPFFWTLKINQQGITRNAGTVVTQGSVTGTLKTSLSGATTNFVIETASGITFTSKDNIYITGVTVSKDDIISANNYGATKCIDCPDGYKQIKKGQESCDGCIRGKYKFSSTECKDCEVGKISIGDANHVCDICPAGSYKTSHTVCSDCAHGQYSLGDVNACTDMTVITCPLGHEYSSASGTFDGLHSYTGSTSNDGLCTICPGGKYKANTEIKRCLICEAGKHSIQSITTFNDIQYQPFENCQNCAQGKYHPTAGVGRPTDVTEMSECKECELGRYNNQIGYPKTVCEVCQKGRYISETGKNQCKKCPAGRKGAFYTGSGSRDPVLHDSIDDCKLCEVLYYNPFEGLDTCYLCITAKVEGSDTCDGCSPGMYKGELNGAEKCFECAFGKYTASQSNTECVNCPTGYYGLLREEGAITDAVTVANELSFAVALNDDSLGTGTRVIYNDNSQTTISELTDGETYYVLQGTTTSNMKLALTKGGTAINIAVGGGAAGNRILVYVPLDRCSGCPRGQYGTGPGEKAEEIDPDPSKSWYVSSGCLQCGSGKYNDQSRANKESGCKLCNKGQWSGLTGADDASDCINCNSGKYNNKKGQNNIDVCEACVPGLYLEAVGSGDESDCLKCPSGFYGTEEGKAFCLPCLPGTRQPISGEIECIPCLSGRFSDSVESNATECQKCGKGQYMNEKGSTICLTCATGKYMNEKESTKCKKCDEHTYIDAREAHVCDVCPTGWSAKDFGQASCQICSVGKFGKSNTQTDKGCHNCPKGFYQEISGQHFCSDCPLGKVFLFFVQFSLLNIFLIIPFFFFKITMLLLGFYTSREAQTFCLSCGEGEYQPNATQTNCKKCAIGQYRGVNNEDKSQCVVCPKGFYTEETKQSFCLGCAAGQYQPDANTRDCKKCATNTFTNEREQSACKMCPTGYSTTNVTAQALCSKCGAGYRGEIINVTLDIQGKGCFECTPGYYREDVGVPDACASCPAGYYTDVKASSFCLACPPGEFASYGKSSRCQDCPIGFFQAEKRSSKCDACTKGQAVNVEGAVLCLECDAGRFAANDETKFCSDCPLGWSQSEKKMTKCTVCPPGKSINLVGSASCDVCAIGRFSNTTMIRNPFSILYSQRNQKDELITKCAECQSGLFQSKTFDQTGFISDCISCDDERAFPKKGMVPNPGKTACIIPPWETKESCKLINRMLDDRKSDNMKWDCSICRRGADCIEATTIKTVLPKNGFWRLPPNFLLSGKDKTELLFSERPHYGKCLFPEDCFSRDPSLPSPTSPSPASNVSCVGNTTGVLCSKCFVGFDRISSKCSKCRQGEIGIRVGIFVALIFVALMLIFSFRKKIKKFHRQYAFAWKDSSIAIQIFINFAQINMSLPNMLNEFEFPEDYLYLLNKLSILQINILPAIGLSCIMELDYRFSVATALCVPVGIVSLCLSLYAWNFCKLDKKIIAIRQNPIQTQRELAGFFDLYDWDHSDSLQIEEFKHILKVCSHKPCNESETKQLMLRIKGEDRFNPELEVTKIEFLREMTSNVPLSLGAMTSQHKVIKHLERQRLKSTFLSSSVQILLLFHAPFSAKGFLYFDCHKMGEKSFIRKDYGIECWSEKWNTFLPFAIILVFGFALMLPLVLGSIVYLKRNDLYHPAVLQEIGFLYGRYNVGSEGWEIVVLIRKLMLTGLLVYLPAMSRTAAGVMVCVWAVAFLNYYEPHKNRHIFWLCNLSYVLQTCKYLATTFEQPRNEGGELEDERGARIMGYLLISMDVAVFVGAMYCVVKIFYDSRHTQHGDTHSLDNYNTLIRTRSTKGKNTRGGRARLANTSVRVQPARSPKRRITLHQIQKAVDKDKVVKFEMDHEKQHKASLDAIRVKKKVAQARVRARLIERRKSKRLQKQSNKQKNEEAAPNPKATVLSSTRKLSQDELAKVERIRLKLLGKVQTEAKLKSIFIKLDFDHNGMMSKKEFVKLLEATLKKNVTEEVVDIVWNAIWEQRKHGDDDEMDASTMNHWLFDRLVASNTLNEDCMNKLKQVAEERAKENDASAKNDEGDNGDKDSIEKIRIKIVSRVKTEKKLVKIFQKIDLDKSNTIDREEFHAFLTAALEVTTGDNVLFEKIWNVVLDIGNEDGERKNDIALLGLKRWLFGSE